VAELKGSRSGERTAIQVNAGSGIEVSWICRHIHRPSDIVGADARITERGDSVTRCYRQCGAAGVTNVRGELPTSNDSSQGSVAVQIPLLRTERQLIRAAGDENVRWSIRADRDFTRPVRRILNGAVTGPEIDRAALDVCH